MRNQLIGLVRLHKLDSEVFDLRARRAEFLGRIENARGALAALQADLDRQKAQLEETGRLRREQEAELKVKEDHIGRAKAKMAAVKNTKEYMAAEREVESARRDTGMVEEQVVQLLQTEEQGRQELSVRQERLDGLTVEAAERTAELEAAVAALDERLATSTTGRGALTQAIDRQLMARYDLIATRLTGAALAACDDGTCAACNMQVRPQVYNLLHQADSLHMCASCKRILFLESWVAEDAASPPAGTAAHP